MALRPRMLLGVALHACNHSDWKAKARRSGEQGHPWLYAEFEVTLGYMRTCLKQGQKNLDFPSLHSAQNVLMWVGEHRQLCAVTDPAHDSSQPRVVVRVSTALQRKQQHPLL